MLLRNPVYYDRFVCLGGICPDSCCQMWDIAVDEESVLRYLSLPGELGVRLWQVLVKDGEGYTLCQEAGRCPMWREDGLCRIQKELGEEALCYVCSQFPRLRHEYEGLTELGLELSCPEAARLILADREGLLIEEGETACQDETLKLLERSRREAFRLLSDGRYSVAERLAQLLLFAYGVQEELDGGEAQAFNPEKALESARTFAKDGNLQTVLEFFSSLEILTEQWKLRLERGPSPTSWTEGHAALARYFVLRYWLQASSDYDLVGRAKFTLLSCLVIRTLGGDLQETAQLYSKEIENDIDNVDALLDGAYTEGCFRDTALLDLLLNT